MFHEQDLATNYGPLHYAQGPFHGPPLVLLHGVTRGWQDWMPVLPQLSARWQTYALDFRGHGQSARTPGKYRTVDYVEDTREVIQKLCPQPPVLVGHSLGAMVALAAAAENSLPVRAIVLEDPPFDTMGKNISQTQFHGLFAGMQQLVEKVKNVKGLMRTLANLPLTNPGATRATRLGEVRDATSLRFSAKCLSRLDPEVLQPIVDGQWLEGYDLFSLVSKIKCPVLLLQADLAAGGMLTDSDADLIVTALSDCCRVRLPGVSHLIHWMETDATLRLVIGFLESL